MVTIGKRGWATATWQVAAICTMTTPSGAPVFVTASLFSTVIPIEHEAQKAAAIRISLSRGLAISDVGLPACRAPNSASKLAAELVMGGDAPINPPDLRQKLDISFFKVQGVNKRFMIGLLRRTMRQSTGAQGPSPSRAETS